MKILYITAHFPYPPNNGARIRDFNIISRLSQKCHLSILSFYERPEQLNWVNELKKYCTELTLIHRASDGSKFIRNFNVLTNPLYPTRPFHPVNYYSPKFKSTIQNLVRTNKFDLVQIGFLHLSQYVNNIPRSVPVLLDTHNVEHIIIGRYAQCTVNKFKRKYLLYQTEKLKRYETIMYPRFNVCLMVSPQCIVEVQPLVPQYHNFRVIPNGVDITYFIPTLKSGEQTVDLIFTGTMSGEMNIDGVLYFYKDILPLIRQQIPRVSLTVVGTNPDKRIRDLAVNDSLVKVTGTVPDVRPYMAASKVLIVPLRVGAGTRLKIVEAMAMGLPIVSTSIGCEGTEVTPLQDILIADTPEQFAHSTINLLTNNLLRNKIAANARNLAETKYSWDIIVNDLFSIYQDTVNGKYGNRM